MKPLTSLLNLTPTSTAVPSPEFRTAGVTVGFHSVVHGQLPGPMVTVTPAPAVWMLPLSSIARLRMLALPTAPGDQSKLHALVPVAVRQVAPPSTDTSTPATTPPPLSLATPLIVTRSPL